MGRISQFPGTKPSDFYKYSTTRAMASEYGKNEQASVLPLTVDERMNRGACRASVDGYQAMFPRLLRRRNFLQAVWMLLASARTAQNFQRNLVVTCSSSLSNTKNSISKRQKHWWAV